MIEVLNSFYGSLDARLKKFRVYQVHNMADEFMIVAGMPQTIGEEHVTEVAAMALDILAACLVFQVPRVTTCHV